MKLERRHVVSALLLAFVAVTAVTLAVKETRHARAVSAAEAAEVARAAGMPTAAPVLAEVPVPPPAAPAAATEAPALAPGAVKARRAASPTAAATVPAVTAVPAEAPSTVVVTYFHATARCASCLKIEDLASTAVTTRFAVPLAEKRLSWRLVNIDEPENNHFIRDYRLYTKSVIVSEVKDGREVRWKNLDQVWKLLNDPEGFQSYVEREVRDYLGPA